MTQMQAANKNTERVSSDFALAPTAAESKRKEKTTTAATKKIAVSNGNKDIKLDYLTSEAWIDREPKYLRI